MANSDKNRMLSARAESLGNISTACKATDISRQSHYRWLKEDDDYAEAVLEQPETVLDISEAMFWRKSKKAIMFILRTKGKERGYDEKRTVSIKQQSSGAP